jgi:hypothetical protein
MVILFSVFRPKLAEALSPSAPVFGSIFYGRELAATFFLVLSSKAPCDRISVWCRRIKLPVAKPSRTRGKMIMFYFVGVSKFSW